jgi:hypothetical protein
MYNIVSYETYINEGLFSKSKNPPSDIYLKIKKLFTTCDANLITHRRNSYYLTLKSPNYNENDPFGEEYNEK